MLALDMPSLAETVIVVEPILPFLGDIVMVRLEPLPPKVIWFTGTKFGSPDVAKTMMFSAAVSKAPTVNAIAVLDPFFTTTLSEIGEINGESFTG